ncbi:MAG: hypothetical protein HY692_02370, partial [Cyanobacteria bacterium NC_groundwater_1444_Ag_S-0.65um_54_12]|nr:hypothetical protein [Cyanobacteria bacterium NC_groundwater_1444_Ag_S-0.65um_54_12]
MRGTRSPLERWSICSALWLSLCSIFTLAVPGWSITRDERGLGILLVPDRTGFIAVLRKIVQDSGRFRLVSASGVSIAAKPPDLLPDPPISLTQRNSLRQHTAARWLLFG